jgi:hypothetical protein
MDEMRNMYKIFVEKHEGKRPLGKARCRRKDKIEINFKRKE